MDDPDWMNDFKTPGEDVLTLSSSSPSSSSSREENKKVDKAAKLAAKGAEDENRRDKSDDEDSPLITAYVRSKKGSRGGSRNVGSVGGRSTSKEGNQSPEKEMGAVGSRESLRDDDEAGDDRADEKETVFFTSKRSRGVKRSLEVEEEADWNPSKIRKPLASPPAKGFGNGAQSKSSRKGRRVSFSGDESVEHQKTKGTINLEDSIDMEEDEDSLPLTSLMKKTNKKKTASVAGSQAANVVDVKVERNYLATLEETPSDIISLSSSKDAPEGTTGHDSARLVKDEAANDDENGAETSEKKTKPRATSSLPVVFADKVHRTKVLLECEGDALDLSGDMGAVGRFSTSSGSGNADDELRLDLKGVIYKTTIIPTSTFLVVNVGQSEAKVEAIMNDFMQLRPHDNQMGDETVVEGTLEGFSFDLETEGDPLGTPATAPGPAESDGDEEFNPKKKKSPTKAQKPKKAAARGSKGPGRPNAAGKGNTKKPKPKAKTGAKKPTKTKPSVAKATKVTKTAKVAKVAKVAKATVAKGA